MYVDVMTLSLGYLCCDEKRPRKHLPHSTFLLDTRGEEEARATQEHLVSNCRRGAQDPPSHLGGRLEASPEQTRVGVPLLLPYMPARITSVSELSIEEEQSCSKKSF